MSNQVEPLPVIEYDNPVAAQKRRPRVGRTHSPDFVEWRPLRLVETADKIELLVRRFETGRFVVHTALPMLLGCCLTLLIVAQNGPFEIGLVFCTVIVVAGLLRYLYELGGDGRPLIRYDRRTDEISLPRRGVRLPRTAVGRIRFGDDLYLDPRLEIQVGDNAAGKAVVLTLRLSRRAAQQFLRAAAGAGLPVR